MRVALCRCEPPRRLAAARGAYDPPPGASDLPGLEGAGTIAAVGAGVARWKVGDRVCALFPGGSYAEHAATDAGQVLPVPDGMSLREAACLPETCFHCLVRMSSCGAVCRRASGSLVHGGSSGIGTTAIQLAHAFGARVFCHCGVGPEMRRLHPAWGANARINYRDEAFRVGVEGRGRGKT